jgi:hypothetical protein
VRFGFKQVGKTGGNVGVDVVNIGMHPIYVESVQLEVPNDCELMHAPLTLGTCQECKLESCWIPVFDRDPT